MIKKISIFFASILAVFHIGCSKAGDTCSYNSVIQYEQGRILTFQDFTVEFTGERTEKSKLPNGNSITMKFYDFNVNTPTTQKIVSWTSGTGDIAPVRFDIDDKNFELELRNSEKLKTKLSENEIVIVKK